MRMKNHTPEEIKLGFDFAAFVKKRDRFAARDH